MRPDFDYRDFIRRNTRLMPVPLVPEISLYMADDATELWQHTEADLDAVGLPPPFWAFAWAGGQALARYLLDRPDHLRGARVLDFASGSGLVAIAASFVGAETATANDIDAFALAATALNAEVNRVEVDLCAADLLTCDGGWDVVLAADIFYERETAGAVTAWLQRLAGRGARVLVGDPGRTYFDRTRFECLARYDVPVMRSLEDADFKSSSVWQLKRASTGHSDGNAGASPLRSAQGDTRQMFQRGTGHDDTGDTLVSSEGPPRIVLAGRRPSSRRQRGATKDGRRRCQDTLMIGKRGGNEGHCWTLQDFR